MSAQPAGPQIVELEPVTVAVLRQTVPMAELRGYYDAAYGTVAAALAAQGVSITGPALGVYFGSPGETVDVAAGFPVATAIDPVNGVTTLTLPAGRAAQVAHAGGYDGLPQAHERLASWMAAEGAVPGSMMWETYLTAPTPDADPADMRTLITRPLAEG